VAASRRHRPGRAAIDYATALAPLGATANGLRPAFLGHRAGTYAFTFGWHVSELPLLTLGAQVLGTAVAGRGGRWRTRRGQVRLISQALSAVGLLTLERAARDSEGVLERALQAGLGADYARRAVQEGVDPLAGPAVSPANPLPTYISRSRYLRAADIEYGPAGVRNRLDIWAAEGLDRGGRAPVLVQIHGGAWTIGDTRHQAYPLMSRLAGAGWVCVPVTYRLSPKATFPDHIVDVKRAIAWVKENISGYGGDPDFVVLTGGSAGGHLCALAALSAGDPGFQPGFEESDTSVQAAVPLYGIYDMRDWDGRGGPAHSLRMVERTVLKVPPASDPELWRRASPISWAGPSAPPMMLVHGTNDSLVPVDGARRMAGTLDRVSNQPVVYAELPFAQHAFDIYASLRTRYTVRAIERFLAYVRAGYVSSRRAGVGGAVPFAPQ
jgi:acetyl esterase/lipase